MCKQNDSRNHHDDEDDGTGDNDADADEDKTKTITFMRSTVSCPQLFQLVSRSNGDHGLHKATGHTSAKRAGPCRFLMAVQRFRTYSRPHREGVAHKFLTLRQGFPIFSSANADTVSSFR